MNKNRTCLNVDLDYLEKLINQTKGNSIKAAFFSDLEEFCLKEYQREWKEMERKQRQAQKLLEKPKQWKKKESWEKEEIKFNAELLRISDIDKMGKFCQDMYEVKNKAPKKSRPRPQIHWKIQKKKKNK